MERIENRTFDEIEPGDTANLVRTLTYILHLVRGSVAGGIAGKPLLACLEEVLRPAIVDVLVQPFTSA